MNALILMSLLVPTSVFAGYRQDNLVGEVKTTEISGKVDVPLLRGPYGDELPYVDVSFDPESGVMYRFQVELGSSDIVIDPGAAEDLGLSVKTRNRNWWKSPPLVTKKGEIKYKAGGKFEYARADAMYIGDGLVLENIRFHVQPMDPAPGYSLEDPVEGVHGRIGAGAIEAAVAVLPSEGVVRFVPSSEGANLVSQVGEPLPFTEVPSEKVKYATVGPTVDKEYHPPVRVADLQVGGEPLSLRLYTGKLTSSVHDVVEPGNRPTLAVGDYDLVWLDFALGGVDLDSQWALVNNETLAPWEGVDGYAAHSLLRSLDIAVDHQGGQVAVAKASEQKREHSLQAYLDRIQTDLDKLQEEPPEDLSDLDEQRAALLVERGRFELLDSEYHQAAIADLEEATSLDPDPCSSWRYLANAYAASGRLDDALEAAIKGQELYAAWYDLSPEERDTILDMDDEELESVQTKPQEFDACDENAGVLATLQIMNGDYDAAFSSYEEWYDLHPLLPLAGGIAAIRTGDLDSAQGPLRQALERARVWGADAAGMRAMDRAALAHVYLANEQPEQARLLWEQEQLMLAADTLAVRLYADIVRAEEGADAVLPALEAMAELRPDAPGVHTVLGEIQEVCATDGCDAFDTAAALYEEELRYRPDDSDILGRYAYHRVVAGDNEGARKTAEAALAENPQEPYGHLALSELLVQEGKPEEALEHWETAVAYGALNVGFSRLGPPVGAMGGIEIDEDRLDIEGRIHFNTGYASIQARSYALLDRVADFVKDHAEILELSIEGHTDSRGDDAFNQELSERRAGAVLEYLVSRGVARDRLTSVGYGESQPLDPSDSEEAWATNRRVEFVIVEIEGETDEEGEAGEEGDEQ